MSKLTVEAIEEFLAYTNANPDFAAQCWNSIPVGQQDQITAAGKSASARTVNPDRVSTVDLLTAPAWLRHSALQSYCDWVNGDADRCSHGPVPGWPQPVESAGWVRVVVCDRCTDMLGDRWTGVCPGCGQKADLGTSTVTIGPMRHRVAACQPSTESVTCEKS